MHSTPIVLLASVSLLAALPAQAQLLDEKNDNLVQLSMPGMQFDPVISGNTIMYREFDDPYDGPLLYLDGIPPSISTREHADGPNAPYHSFFPALDNGVSVSVYPESPPLGRSHHFKAKVLIRGPGMNYPYTLGGNHPHAKTAVWAGTGYATSRYLYMRLNQWGNWDIIFHPIPVDTAWQNVGDPELDDVDPAIGKSFFAWAQHRPAQSSYVVSINHNGRNQDIGSGRFPSIADDILAYEGRHNRLSGATTTIQIFDLAQGRATPLPGLPLTACKHFRRPVIGGQYGRLVIYRAEGCNAYGDAPQLLVTDRIKAKTYRIAELPRYDPDDEPALYDINEKGEVLFSAHGGGNTHDFDLWYWRE